MCRHCATNSGGPFHDHPHDHHADRDGHQGNQRQGRRNVEHHRNDTQDRQQGREQLAQRLGQALGDVVDVVGHPAEQLAPRLPVEEAEREPVDLLLDLGPHPIHGPLHHVVDQIPLQPAEQRGHHVEGEHQHEHLAHSPEVHTLTRHDVVHRRNHGRDPGVARRPERLDRLLDGDTGRQLLAEQTGEDQVRGPTENPGAYRKQRDTDYGEQHDRGGLSTLRCHPSQHPFRRGPEVHCLLANDEAAARPPAARSAWPDPLGQLHRAGRGRLLGAHASSSALNWDSTICW